MEGRRVGEDWRSCGGESERVWWPAEKSGKDTWEQSMMVFEPDSEV